MYASLFLSYFCAEETNEKLHDVSAHTVFVAVISQMKDFFMFPMKMNGGGKSFMQFCCEYDFCFAASPLVSLTREMIEKQFCCVHFFIFQVGKVIIFDIKMEERWNCLIECNYKSSKGEKSFSEAFMLHIKRLQGNFTPRIGASDFSFLVGVDLSRLPTRRWRRRTNPSSCSGPMMELFCVTLI